MVKNNFRFILTMRNVNVKDTIIQEIKLGSFILTMRNVNFGGNVAQYDDEIVLY